MLLTWYGCNGEIFVPKHARDASNLVPLSGSISYGTLYAVITVESFSETDNLGTQLLRSGTLFGTTICFFFAHESIDQGKAAATFQVAPLIISLLAVLFLGEILV